jgi:hypothetical protein
MKKELLSFAIILFAFNSIAQNFEWAKRLGSSRGDAGYSVTTDKSGNVYTTGSFGDVVDFDPGTGTYNLTADGSFEDMFISKLDASGNFIWAKSIGGIPNDRGYSIAVDAAGNVYISGYFQGTADFDPGPNLFKLTATGGLDIFILKLDASGNFLWAKQIGESSYDDWSYFITLDKSGNLYLTGSFALTVDFDPGTGTSNLTSAGGGDIFLLKLDASGNFLWAKSMGGSNNDDAYSIAIDLTGNVYITGSYFYTTDFDPGSGTSNLTSKGGPDIFLSKYDSLGNYLWAKSFGSTDYDRGYSVVVDSKGNVYCSGKFIGTVDFDPGNGTFNMVSANSGINEDMFLLKLNPSGNFVWAKKIGATGQDEGRSLAIDKLNNIYCSGSFSGTADFDPGTGTVNLTASGTSDIYILKLDSSGNYSWVQKFGGNDDTHCFSLSIDAQSNIYTTGYFSKTTDFDPSTGTYNLTSAGSLDIFVCKISGCSVKINNQPTDQSAKINTGVKFTISTTNSNATYQWQEDAGSGFKNISNGGQYSGATNDTLLISGIKISQNNYKYRCIVFNSSCSDTSNVASLIVKTIGIKVSSTEMSSIYPNPVKDLINIKIKNSSSDISYSITDQLGRIVMFGKLNTQITQVDISKLARGHYYITVGNTNKEIFIFLKE